MKVYQMDQDWQHKGELFLAWWVYDDSGNQGRDATSWAHDQGMDLTTDGIFQVIPDCETCAAIKQAKCQVLVIRGQWLKYKYGEAWHINYITHPQTHQARHYMLTIVDTTEWLEMYATAQSTILGTEKQVLWWHGTWVRQWNLFQNLPHRYLGQRARDWMDVSHSLSLSGQSPYLQLLFAIRWALLMPLCPWFYLGPHHPWQKHGHLCCI